MNIPNHFMQFPVMQLYCSTKNIDYASRNQNLRFYLTE